MKFPSDVEDRLAACGVIPVVTIDRAEDAVPLARALVACGIDAIEICLRSPGAIEAIEKVATEVPGCLVGAGTLLRPQDVSSVIKAGARFAVSPGLDEEVVAAAGQQGLPMAPGVLTPTELQRAVAMGCRYLELYPVDPVGGPAYVRCLYAPYEHLGLKFIVSGGIAAEQVRAYLNQPGVLAIGGSWIAPRTIIESQNWSSVIDRATETAGHVKDARSP